MPAVSEDTISFQKDWLIDWVEISHQLSLLLAVYLSAERSPEPPPPTPSHRAHCKSRPHLVPNGWFFTCCCIVFPLARETNNVFPQECFSCLDQNQANENKMEQNNVSSSDHISASKSSIHIYLVCGVETVLHYLCCSCWGFNLLLTANA